VLPRSHEDHHKVGATWVTMRRFTSGPDGVLKSRITGDGFFERGRPSSAPSVRTVLWCPNRLGNDGLLGSIRDVQIAIGPLWRHMTTASMLRIPHFAQRESRTRLSWATWISAFAVGLTCVGLVVAILLREPLAQVLLDGSFVLHTDLPLPPSAVQLFGAGALGAVMYIRPRGSAPGQASSRVISALASIPLVVLPAWWASAGLLTWSLAVQGLVFTAAIFMYRLVVRKAEAESATVDVARLPSSAEAEQ
jgi:hypothetical protein